MGYGCSNTGRQQLAVVLCQSLHRATPDPTRIMYSPDMFRLGKAHGQVRNLILSTAFHGGPSYGPLQVRLCLYLNRWFRGPITMRFASCCSLRSLGPCHVTRVPRASGVITQVCALTGTDR